METDNKLTAEKYKIKKDEALERVLYEKKLQESFDKIRSEKLIKKPKEEAARKKGLFII